MRLAPLPFLLILLSLGFSGLTSLQAQQAYYAAGYHAAQAAAQQQRQQHEAAWHRYYQELAAYQAAQRGAPVQAMPRPQPTPAPAVRQPSHAGLLRYDGRYAAAHVSTPGHVQHAVYAANRLQGKPYRMGGGHARVNDNAYDCSGTVSFVLIHSGLLRAPLSSKEFANYGKPGPGRFITIYVKPGEHVFMTICGLRLDTTGGREGEGPRWRPKPRSTDGFILRHPAGL